MDSYLPFYATQIINPFLNSRISANLDVLEVHYANNGEIIIMGFETLL